MPTPSYTTEQIYSAIPQVLQDQDAANGYPLWEYLYGVCQVLDNIDTLMFHAMGAGVTVTPTHIAPQPITQAKLLNALSANATSFTIFGTDATWQQLPISSAFTVMLENEEILVPSGTYNWTAPSVTFTGVTRGYNNTFNVQHAPSSGANGTIDLNNYYNADGWSQILDINRCPEYALPWLGQFIGAGLPQDNTFTYQEALDKIQNRSGFQRATTAAIIREIVAVINSQIPPSTTPLLPSQVIALENTLLMGNDGASLAAAITSTTATSLALLNADSKWGTLGNNSSFVIQIDSEKILIPQGAYAWTGAPITITGVTRGYASTTKATHALGASVSVLSGVSIYGFSEYALTLLVPSPYYTTYTYASLAAAAGGSSGSYTTLIAFIDSLGGFYNNLAGSSIPSSSSPYVNFVYRYRPAGLQIFVGGY